MAVANYASAIRPLPPTALDPDHLEQQYAANLRGMEPGFQIPFLMGAMIDRRMRGQQIAESNAAANAQQMQLAQEGMALDERGQLRTLAGIGLQHGMPVTPTLMTPGGMPTLEENQRYATVGNQNLMQESTARAASAYGTAAQHALEGGVSPNALPGMMNMARETPLAVQRAGAGSGGTRFEAIFDPNRPDEPQMRVRSGTLEGMNAGTAALRQQTTQNQGAATARQLITQHPQLRTAVEGLQQQAERAGSRVVGITGDPNTVTITVERNGQRESRTLDRQGRQVTR